MQIVLIMLMLACVSLLICVSATAGECERPVLRAQYYAASPWPRWPRNTSSDVLLVTWGNCTNWTIEASQDLRQWEPCAVFGGCVIIDNRQQFYRLTKGK